MKGTDWESVMSKYTDILELYRKELLDPEEASQVLKDYRHTKDEITKEILTAKLKAIRIKFCQAVDSGRRSGHGRVVYLYYNLCEKVWGGSPATEQLDAGVETLEMEDSQFLSQVPPDLEVNNDTDYGIETSNDQSASSQVEKEHQDVTDPDLSACSDSEQLDSSESNQPASNGSEQSDSQQSASQQSAAGSSHSQQSGSNQSEQVAGSESEEPGSSDGKFRRGQKRTSSEFSEYRQQKLKKKVSADKQLMHFAEQELELKKKLAERFETVDKEHSETMKLLTSNLKSLSDTMASAFALQQQSLQQPFHNPYSHHYGHYAAPPTPPRSMYQVPPGFLGQGHPRAPYSSPPGTQYSSPLPSPAAVTDNYQFFSEDADM